MQKGLQLPLMESAPRAMVPRSVAQPLVPSQVYGPYSLAAPAPAPEDTISLTDLLGHIWRQKWLISAAAAVGLLAGIGAALLVPQVYRAQTTLQLEGFNSDVFYWGLSPMSGQAPTVPPERYLQNQIALLRSDKLALRVADRLQLAPSPAPKWAFLFESWRQLTKQKPLSPEQEKIMTFRLLLDVQPNQNSEVLQVFFSASTPDMAARGANAVATEFIELNREQRDAQVETTTQWLGKQTGGLKAKLAAASEAMQAYASSSGLVFSGPEDQTTLAKERMRSLEASFVAAQADRAAKQARYEAALSATPEVMPEGVLQGSYRQSVTDLQNLRRQLADLKTIFTPAHQKVRSLEAQIAALETGLRTERNEAVGRLRTEYLAAAGLETRLAQAHAEQLRTMQSQAAVSARYNLLKREVETMQQVYDAMLQKEKEAGMAAALRATNVRVIDAAQPPASPYSPKVPLYATLGLALGSFGGLFLAVLRERPNILRQPGDTAGLPVPELGAIPSARLDPAQRGSRRWTLGLSTARPLELAAWSDGTSLLRESFRSTLTSILFRADAGSRKLRPDGVAEGQTLVFTSAEPVEGKTTVAANLAIALTDAGRKVLLIDADMRRPRLHAIFDLINDKGLTDLLAGGGNDLDAALDDLVRPTQIPNLWLLPSGQGGASVSRLLYSPALEHLLTHAKTRFDLVLVDSPPVSLYADARMFGKLSDGVVLVVRANKTSRETVRAVFERLMDDGIPILGTVLNDWSFETGSGKSYAAYYRYRHH